MAPDDESLLSPALAELGRLRDALRDLVSARWRLVRLELAEALGQVLRLAAALAVAAVLALISLPIAAVAVADLLSGILGIDRTGWLLVEFAALVLMAATVGFWAWRRFRTRFVGLEESLEELQADAQWLHETLLPILGGRRSTKDTTGNTAAGAATATGDSEPTAQDGPDEVAT